MALVASLSGTLTSVIGVETNFFGAQTPGSPVHFTLVVDLGALAAGEVAIVRIYTIVLAAGVERLAYPMSFLGGVDADPIMYSVPVPTDVSYRATIQQKNGTGRSFPFKLFSF